MAMFLGGCPVFLIMMIGRWSSDAFLWYIRKQVEEFNHDVSRKMLTHMFHRPIPNYSSQTVSHLDPRQRNHPHNAKTRRNVGGDMARQAGLPAFSQFHWALRSYTGGATFLIHFIYRLLRHLQTLDCTNMEEASLLVPTESGRRDRQFLTDELQRDKFGRRNSNRTNIVLGEQIQDRKKTETKSGRKTLIPDRHINSRNKFHQ